MSNALAQSQNNLLYAHVASAPCLRYTPRCHDLPTIVGRYGSSRRGTERDNTVQNCHLWPTKRAGLLFFRIDGVRPVLEPTSNVPTAFMKPMAPGVSIITKSNVSLSAMELLPPDCVQLVCGKYKNCQETECWLFLPLLTTRGKSNVQSVTGRRLTNDRSMLVGDRLATDLPSARVISVAHQDLHTSCFTRRLPWTPIVVAVAAQ